MIRPFASILVPTVFFAIISGCSGSVGGEYTCFHGHDGFVVGESFSPDGCNTCTCMEDGGLACTEMACIDTCSFNGEIHEVGETFPAGDGCNTCECMEGGEVGCTLIGCEGPICLYEGAEYFPGESFPSVDGCNTCTCQDDGTVSCTEIACPCDPESEWWRDYVSTDPQECALIDFGCPPNTAGFENQCGCGCEQDPSCPEVFDCQPPKQCDLEALHEQCPYSTIAL
jgi:hypothetical protein